MSNNTKISIIILSLVIVSCGFWKNFTTYFNTYYNAERLISESEKEFEYQDEKFIYKIGPRAIAPEYELSNISMNDDDIPTFMNEFVINKTKLQPVRVKLDSVIIKGSKILANKRESDFIEGTLYLMAQAYFYKSEWLPCQVKCGELIDVYPDGKKSPDAHLLFSKALLIQKKFEYGKKMLSRTVDIAWQLERYDILSEAFRLQADLALYEEDTEGALRPYKQAVAQSSNSKLSAKWQLELALILYKLQQFERAIPELQSVYEDFNPEYVQLYEAKLYEAICHARLNNFEKSDKIFTYLEEDGKFDEHLGYTKIGRLYILRSKLQDTGLTARTKAEYTRLLDTAQMHIDTAYIGYKLMFIYRYERGIDKYYADDYEGAKQEFDKAKQTKTDIYGASYSISKKLETILKSRSNLRPYNNVENNDLLEDKQLRFAADASFSAGRAFDALGKPDSVLYYYKKALTYAPKTDKNRPRYLYAVANTLKESDPDKTNPELHQTADSLLQVIVDDHPNTVYSVEVLKILGFTDAYLVDTAKEAYTSGNQLRSVGEYEFAITKFLEVFNKFPKSNYSPKSLYAVGWIYEKELLEIDSAFKYYSLLLENYPQSAFANDIRISLAYLENKILGTEIPDSLNVAKIKSDLKTVLNDDEINNQLPQVPGAPKHPNPRKSGLFGRAKDFLKSTIGSQIDSATNQINSFKEEKFEQFNELKELDLDSLKTIDPKSLIKNPLLPSDDTLSVDSTNTKKD